MITKKSEINSQYVWYWINPNYVTTNCSGVKNLEIFKQEVPRENLNLEKSTPLELENLNGLLLLVRTLMKYLRN